MKNIYLYIYMCDRKKNNTSIGQMFFFPQALHVWLNKEQLQQIEKSPLSFMEAREKEYLARFLPMALKEDLY